MTGQQPDDEDDAGRGRRNIIVLVVVVVGIALAWLIPRPSVGSAPSAPSQASIQGRQTQNNGLTKDTNDFLRQLSQHPPGLAKQ